MKNQNKKEKGDVADTILSSVSKIIPGFSSFFKKGEGSGKFGSRMKKIRDEMNRRFGKK